MSVLAFLPLDPVDFSGDILEVFLAFLVFLELSFQAVVVSKDEVVQRVGVIFHQGRLGDLQAVILQQQVHVLQFLLQFAAGFHRQLCFLAVSDFGQHSPQHLLDLPQFIFPL